MIARARGRVHYAWIVLGVTFFTLLAAAGVRSTPGVLIVPLEREFGWTTAMISAAVSINLVLFGLCGPFAAAFMARYGIRRVMVTALLVISVGVGLTTFMRTLWQLYLLWGVVVGLGTGSMASVLAATVANRWFVARRGLVTGILTASLATGQLIFLPLLASLTTLHGWRWASATVSLAALTAVPVVALLMRDSPRDVGLEAYGAGDVDETAAPVANPFGAAIDGLRTGARSSTFWLLTASFFICGATTNGLVGTHLIPASMDHGVPEVEAASMLALIGVFDIIGTTVSGWLTDRADSRWLLFWYYGLRGLALLLLPFALSSTLLALLLFIVFYGLDWVATVPPTIALTTRNFGKQQGSIVYGWIFASHQLGAAFAAFAAGAMRTWLGDYQLTFISAGLLCMIASGLVIRIRRSASSPSLPLSAEPA
jgi:predicted MFS family arabinose efflux permease